MKKQVKWYKTQLVWMRSWITFILALALLAGFWYGCYWLVATYAVQQLYYFKIGAWVAVGIGLVTLLFNEPIVVYVMGAKRVRHRDQCPKFWDAVHEVTPLRARPMPRIYLLPERSMNAISFGLGLPLLSAVGATSGAVEKLSREELKAVMAHEIGHVINRDILVSTAMTISIMMMAFTGYLLLRIGPYNIGSSRSSRSSSSDSKGSGAAVLLVTLLVGLLLYGFGRFLGIVLQMFVSRQREYAADAASAQIMGSSQPLISALHKILSNPRVSSNMSSAVVGFLCTADPDRDDLMDTHPDPEKRFRALEWLEK